MKKHEHWGSRIGFVLASAGSAIGLGSLWRFPFVAGDSGGGAFVLLYLFFTLTIALPALVGEFILGRQSQRSSVLAYAEVGGSPNWRVLGWISFLTTFLILSYYNIVAGWCLNYAFMSLVHFTKGRTPEEITSAFSTLYSSGDITLFWLIVYILLNVGVVSSGVRKGIERWSRILMPFLLLILVSLFLFSTTLPGFGEAFSFIFSPDFHKLSPSSILTALGMALFTLSVGLGINITYGSYVKEDEDLPKMAGIVALMTTLVSLISALMIFPIVFSYGYPPQGGPGLIFKTMPLLFSKLPGGMLLSTTFFLLVVFAALTSTIALLEVLVANLMELLNWPRKKVMLWVCLAVFIMGIPSALAGSNSLFPAWKTLFGENFFDFISDLTANWMMPFAALFGTLFIGWKMEKPVLSAEYGRPRGSRVLFVAWFYLIRYFVPVAITCILLQQAGLV